MPQLQGCFTDRNNWERVSIASYGQYEFDSSTAFIAEVC